MRYRVVGWEGVVGRVMVSSMMMMMMMGWRKKMVVVVVGMVRRWIGVVVVGGFATVDGIHQIGTNSAIVHWDLSWMMYYYYCCCCCCCCCC